jgi:hydrogenase maturation protease
LEVLILGIGNILLGDEGAGCRAVEELERRYVFPSSVRLLDGGTAGLELLPAIAEADHLIIIDALAGGRPPGTVVQVEGENVPATFLERISPHQIGISDVLASASITGELPESLVLYGIEPKSLNTGLELSEPVRLGLEKIVIAVVKELDGAGLPVVPHKMQ